MNILRNISNSICKSFLISGYSRTIVELERLGYHKEHTFLIKKLKRLQKTI